MILKWIKVTREEVLFSKVSCFGGEGERNPLIAEKPPKIVKGLFPAMIFPVCFAFPPDIWDSSRRKMVYVQKNTIIHKFTTDIFLYL